LIGPLGKHGARVAPASGEAKSRFTGNLTGRPARLIPGARTDAAAYVERDG